MACASGRDYARHTAAMLHSVLEHRGNLRLHAHYLVGPRFPARSARQITEMVGRDGGAIEFHTIGDHRLAGLPNRASFDPAVWYRLFLPELLPDVDRVLYIDGDALAVDDLTPLWHTDLGDEYAAAVPNVLEPWNSSRPADLGLSGPTEYLNSGVLLLDLRRMRADDMTMRLVTYARSRGDRLSGLDQDTLSAVLAGRWRRLHPRWNCMNSVMTFEWAGQVLGEEAVHEARRRPGIRHFEGPGANKPWHLLCERDLRELYLRHRRATPWPRVRRTGITPANLARAARRSREG